MLRLRPKFLALDEPLVVIEGTIRVIIREGDRNLRERNQTPDCKVMVQRLLLKHLGGGAQIVAHVAELLAERYGIQTLGDLSSGGQIFSSRSLNAADSSVVRAKGNARRLLRMVLI